MKVVKPQRLGVLQRVFEHGADTWFALTGVVFFDTRDGRALPEVALWTFAPQELGRDAVLDAAMPKSRGEVLVCGRAYPRNPPQAACTVRVRLGSVDKSLLVVGDRVWRDGGMTAPVPFAEMPMTWERAYGGDGFAHNPLGRGYGPDGATNERPLPNIEHPARRIVSPHDRPTPAGFGPLDFSWPQRFSKVGTYDARWLRERYPGLADDIDWTLFNAAPDDQWIEGFFTGDERFTAENLHPDHAALEGVLPALRLRAFVTLRRANPDGSAREDFVELPMRADTVWLFPHAERGAVLYRGTTRIADDDADDVLHLVLAAERLADAPRERAYYADVLARRLDRTKAHLYVLRDDELMPPDDGTPRRDAGDGSDMAALMAREGLLEQRLHRNAQRRLDETRARITAAGLDPAAAGLPERVPPPEPPPDASKLAAIVETADAQAERAKQSMATQREVARQRFESLCAEHGLDADALRKRNEESGGPPRFSAEGERAALRATAVRAREAGTPMPLLEARADDPRLYEKLQRAEAHLRDYYARFAHHQPTAPRRDEASSAPLRDALLAAVASKNSVAHMDLTGATLGALSLAGADLRGVWMERVDLTNADLRGADLRGAVLARATLAGARLDGAKLAEANLGHAELTGATLDGCDLTGAVLWSADLTGARFVGATLTRADLTGARFVDTDLSGVALPGVTLVKTDLRGARLAGATLTQAVLIESVLDEVDLTGATLTQAVLLQCTGRRAVLRDAQATNLRCVHGSDFEGAVFHRATLDSANFRGAKLAGADFSEASLRGAELSAADLRGARLFRAVASDARFVRADLTGAVLLSAKLDNAMLTKAKLHGADLRGANLFAADMARFTGDSATDLTAATLTRVRFIAPRDPPPST